ncbi:hypothetical protein DSECCO2_625360 [anaerobic digester metagenome]
MNTRPARGSLSLQGQTMVSSSLSGFMPFICSMSRGEGRKATTASSSGCTPMLRKADPQNTGTMLRAMVALRTHEMISSSVSSSPPRYFSSRASSSSATASTMARRFSRYRSIMSAGTSSSVNSTPLLDLSNLMALPLIRSTTPSNLSSLPMGSWMGMGFARRRSTIMSTQRKKLAPMRSILLTKQMRGTP